MSRTNWILIGLMAVIAVVGIVMLNDTDHAAQLAQARRDAAFSAQTRDIVMGLIALAIGGYLVWFFAFRKE